VTIYHQQGRVFGVVFHELKKGSFKSFGVKILLPKHKTEKNVGTFLYWE